jgi:hypothetical protein
MITQTLLLIMVYAAFSLYIFCSGYFSPKKGCPKVLKFSMGFIPQKEI